MKMLKNKLSRSSLLLAAGLALSNVTYAQEEVLGQFYSQTLFAGEVRDSGVRTAVLNDVDLIRGNNENESIFQRVGDTNSDPLELFNGYITFDTVNFRVAVVEGEASVSVFFNDGTVLDDVNALADRFISFGATTNLYLLDQNALSAAGKSLHDVVDITFNEFVDHDLNYSDFGFGSELDGGSDNPGDDTPDTIQDEEGRNIIVGTNGRDNLRGTNEADVFLSLGGERDVMAGNGGQDVFVVGSEANNGRRDRDIIVDFDIFDDTLVLENGASIRSSRVRNGSLVIRLDGSDRDIIRLRGVDTDISSINVISINGDF